MRREDLGGCHGNCKTIGSGLVELKYYENWNVNWIDPKLPCLLSCMNVTVRFL